MFFVNDNTCLVFITQDIHTCPQSNVFIQWSPVGSNLLFLHSFSADSFILIICNCCFVQLIIIKKIAQVNKWMAGCTWSRLYSSSHFFTAISSDFIEPKFIGIGLHWLLEPGQYWKNSIKIISRSILIYLVVYNGPLIHYFFSRSLAPNARIYFIFYAICACVSLCLWWYCLWACESQFVLYFICLRFVCLFLVIVFIWAHPSI